MSIAHYWVVSSILKDSWIYIYIYPYNTSYSIIYIRNVKNNKYNLWRFFFYIFVSDAWDHYCLLFQSKVPLIAKL